MLVLQQGAVLHNEPQYMDQGSHSTELGPSLFDVVLLKCNAHSHMLSLSLWVPFYDSCWLVRKEKQKRQSIQSIQSISDGIVLDQSDQPHATQGSFHHLETSRWWFPCPLKLDTVEWPENRKPLIASVVWKVCFSHKWDASCRPRFKDLDQLSLGSLRYHGGIPRKLFQCFDCRALHTTDTVKVGSLWWGYFSC